jgi:hypothetical protein
MAESGEFRGKPPRERHDVVAGDMERHAELGHKRKREEHDE